MSGLVMSVKCFKLNKFLFRPSKFQVKDLSRIDSLGSMELTSVGVFAGSSVEASPMKGDLSELDSLTVVEDDHQRPLQQEQIHQWRLQNHYLG